MFTLNFKENKIYRGASLLFFLYLLLFVCSRNFPYFWDGVVQTSIEGFNYYNYLFGTENTTIDHAYAPSLFPMMGLLTALLWKIFGIKLWVSHAFVFLCSLFLIYNVHRIVQSVFDRKHVGIVALIVLVEPTILSQFVIAGIDIIIFTAFVVSLRGVLERKRFLLGVGMFFLLNIYSRGFFIGIILLAVDYYFNYYKTPKPERKSLFLFFLPYTPAFFFFAAALTVYFGSGSRFEVTRSSYSNHYILPESLKMVVEHFMAFVLRSVENGRFLIWGFSLVIGYRVLRTKNLMTRNLKIIVSILLLHFFLYFIFIFISQMPFSARYFMPHYFLLSLFCIWGITQFYNKKVVAVLLLSILAFQITGNFWIYPDRMAKGWDCTLAHIPYYELRKDCFNYIEEAGIDYDEVSSGFCLYGNRGYAELDNFDKTIHADNSRRYFLYSNISNMDDTSISEFEDTGKWKTVNTFKKGKVFIALLEKIEK